MRRATKRKEHPLSMRLPDADIAIIDVEDAYAITAVCHRIWAVACVDSQQICAWARDCYSLFKL